MRYHQLKTLSNEQFRRLTGVNRDIFDKMLKILRLARRSKPRLGGTKHLLSIADMLLVTLEYLREYRTYFHIANSYNISESTVYRYVKWVENTLIKSKEFSLPSRRELQKSDINYEVILIDATETPIQRPKKNNANIIQVRKNGTP